MSWGAQNRSEDAKTPGVAGVRSEKPELDRCPIQPYTYLHKTALALAEPLQVFTLSQSLLCLLLFLHRTLSPRHFNEPYAIGYQSAVAVPTLATWEVGAP
jgi:hypothetical protein